MGSSSLEQGRNPSRSRRTHETRTGAGRRFSVPKTRRPVCCVGRRTRDRHVGGRASDPWLPQRGRPGGPNPRASAREFPVGRLELRHVPQSADPAPRGFGRGGAPAGRRLSAWADLTVPSSSESAVAVSVRPPCVPSLYWFPAGTPHGTRRDWWLLATELAR